LSVETAASVDAYAFVPASKTWARIRWGGIAAFVGVFLLVVGAAYVVTGDPTRRVDTSVAGVLLLFAGGVLLGASIWRLMRKGRGGSAS
jgi:zinc transporter ZupT